MYLVEVGLSLTDVVVPAIVPEPSTLRSPVLSRSRPSSAPHRSAPCSVFVPEIQISSSSEAASLTSKPHTVAFYDFQLPFVLPRVVDDFVQRHVDFVHVH